MRLEALTTAISYNQAREEVLVQDVMSLKQL